MRKELPAGGSFVLGVRSAAAGREKMEKNGKEGGQEEKFVLY